MILQPAPVEVGDAEGSGGRRSAKRIGAKAATLLEIIRELAQAGAETPRHSELSEIAAKRGVRIDPTAVSAHINVLESEGLIVRGGTRNQRTYALPGTSWTTAPAPLANAMKYGPEREGPPRSPTLEERRAMFAHQRYEDGPEKPGPLVRWPVPEARARAWASPLTEK